jgi:hypothetical protein
MLVRSNQFLILFFFLALAQTGFSQTTWKWYWRNNGSDYKVTGDFDIDSGCDCTDSYGFSIYLDNYLPGSRKVNSSKSKGDYSVTLGPNASHRFLALMKVEGKNDFSIFDCFSSCESSGNDNDIVTTRPIKRPVSGSVINEGSSIFLSWRKGSDIPNKDLKYRIARDEPDNIIATVSGLDVSYRDEQAGPGEHTYYIFTRTDKWGGHTSSPLIIYGGFSEPPSFTATNTFPEKVTLNWEDLTKKTSEFRILRDGEEIDARTEIDGSDTTFTDREASLIPGYQYQYTINWSDGVKDYEVPASGGILPNGRIKGKVLTPGSRLPVENVEVCAELESDIDQDLAGTIYCDTTDANGQYEIRQIYYNREATFRVTPRKTNHGFDPAFYTERLLELSRPDLANLDFQDTTSFTVSGYVTQELNGVACGLGDVEIWVNDIYKGVTTDENGYYEFLAEETGTYNVEPRYRDHSFVPGQREIFVDSETGGMDFTDTQTRTISGKVLATCDIYIGQAGVRVLSVGGSGCIDTLLLTDANGDFGAQLPAREYQVEVVQFSPRTDLNLFSEQVTGYFTTTDADLTDEDQSVDFIYREKPTITVSGLDQPACSDLAFAIVEQDDRYLVDIEVNETFGDESCPVEEGYVLVYDEVGDRANEPDSIPIFNGLAVYELRPGMPNLVAPHQKVFEVLAVVDAEEVSWSEPMIVTGVRPREQTFTTVSPEVPFQILHDPPGDASYSYFARNSTSTMAMRLYGQAEGSITTQSQIKVGSAVSQTIFPGTSINAEVWGTVGASFSVGATVARSQEWIMSMTNSEQFTTSNSEQITGEEGDVFIGAAMNLIYAQADVLTYDPSTCNIAKDVDLIMGNDGFSTTFMYTEQHVRDILIPQLTGIRDTYEQNGSDSARIYDNQIAVWKQVLDQNRENKSKAAMVENRSFSAGATYSSSLTSAAEGVLSMDVQLFMESSIVLGAGYEVAGSGVQGSVATNIRMEVGKSTTLSQLEERTTGFELKDDDPGDFFSVDVKKDPVYGTPVFQLVSGRSSCPWEPGTQPRETPQLQADRYTQRGIPAGEAGVFELSLANISQSDEARTYSLRFLQESNPDGAVVTIGGSQAQNAIPYQIGPGQARQATVTVSAGPRASSYDGLQFVLGSGCGDDQLSDTVALNVGFQSTYPSLVVNQPYDQWLVNSGSFNELEVSFTGLDREQLNKVQLLYSPKDRYTWTIGQEWQLSDLPENNENVTTRWDVSGLPEGVYDLRLRTDYSEVDVYSETITGLIDRTAPRVFGRPAPADGLLSTGDLISISFDEPVQCFTLNQESVSLRNTSTGEAIPMEIGCADNKIILQPLWQLSAQVGESFQVTLFSVSDRHQNTNSEPVSWAFTVENPDGTPVLDTDLDGIPNAEDNCRLAANPEQRDIDGDGIGDLCDMDIDGDGVPNDVDNCPFVPNPDQADTDQDGTGDTCEPEADGDGDGISNAVDNCPLTANPDQADQDQDGIGDVCDNDIDGDGIRSDLDNCPEVANPDQSAVCDDIVSTNNLSLGLENIRIQPNPARDEAWLELTLQKTGEWSIAIIGLDGKTYARLPAVTWSAGSQRIALPLNGVQPGMYFVQLESTQGVIARKLVVR